MFDFPSTVKGQSHETEARNSLRCNYFLWRLKLHFPHERHANKQFIKLNWKFTKMDAQYENRVAQKEHSKKTTLKFSRRFYFRNKPNSTELFLNSILLFNRTLGCLRFSWCNALRPLFFGVVIFFAALSLCCLFLSFWWIVVDVWMKK